MGEWELTRGSGLGARGSGRAGRRAQARGHQPNLGHARLEDANGNVLLRRPGDLAAAKGGVEVHRGEAMELRGDDKVRFTRNDLGSGLTNGDAATVESVDCDSVRYCLEIGSVTTLGPPDSQLRRTDRAFAATAHAFQGRTVDRILAAMPTGDAQWTNQPALYVAISRARDTVELVTDDDDKLAGQQLQRATDERLAAFDATAEQAAQETVFGREPDRGPGRTRDTRLRRDGTRPRNRARRATRAWRRAGFRSLNRPRSPSRARTEPPDRVRSWRASRREVTRSVRSTRCERRRIPTARATDSATAATPAGDCSRI